MSPDPTFVRELKKIASGLSVEWCHPLKRFVIWYKNDQGERHRILEVKNPDGSFRPLDKRTLDTLRRCDMSRQANSPAYYFSEQYRIMKEEKEKARRKHREQMRLKSRDMKSQWEKAIDLALYKNIYYDHQLRNPKIYSIPKTNDILIKKLGRPANHRLAKIL